MKKLLLATAALGVFSGAFAKKVKFQVDMTGQTVSGAGVHIAGDFQSEAGASGDWQPGATQLTNGGSGNIYSIVVDIPAHKYYEFKFINGNDWPQAEGVPALNQKGHTNNGQSNDNRWFYIDSTADDTTIFPAVMFGGSAPSGMFAVRFAVDMQLVSAVSTDGVHIAGSVQNPGWNPASNALTNLYNSNKVYEWIAYLAAGTYEFKYINGNAWGSDESVPSACATNNNRSLTVAANEALAKVCFASCAACPSAPLPRYMAGFVVDMANSDCDGGFDSVTVAGGRPELTNWTTGVKLVKMGPSTLYGAFIQLDSGELKFKFRYHKNGNTNWEAGDDRVWVLSADDSTDLTCFGSRSVGPCPAKPAPSKVTFMVDLSNETPDGQGRIYVIGTFATPNWQAGAIRMTPVNNKPGFFEAVVNGVCPGTFAYKFVNGDSSNSSMEENFPDSNDRGCLEPSGVGGWNRTYTRTSAGDVVLAYVFNSCDMADTTTVGLRGVAGQLEHVRVFPNPTSSSVNIEFNDQAKSHDVVITDIAGKTLSAFNGVEDNKLSIGKSELANGMLFIHITNNRGETKTMKLIVQ